MMGGSCTLKILHLSDTGLSGAPIRLSRHLSRHSGGVIESRHIVWEAKTRWREFDTDLVGMQMTDDELSYWLNWADIIHFHNRFLRQEIFRHVSLPKNKKFIAQIHSPRESEDFSELIQADIPIACVAQYHSRQWPECKYIVPNIVDITDPANIKDQNIQYGGLTRVSYAPSNANGTGWDDKSYGIVGYALKRKKLAGQISYDLIFNVPHDECLARKRLSDIGVDEISTGSYHMSSLEYLSMGIACIGYIDTKTEKVVKDLTGATWLPWIQTTKDQFNRNLEQAIHDQAYIEYGRLSRLWMEQFWNPEVLVNHYKRMYEAL